MALVSAEDFFKYRESGKRRALSDDLVFSFNKSGNKSTRGFNLVFGISKALAKKAKFIEGDKVTFLFDCEARVGLLKRKNDGRWVLTSGGKSGGSRLYFKILWQPGMPSAKKSVGCVWEVTEEGIEFIFPDEVSFTQNLRAGE